MNILGLHYGHDASVSIIKDGKVLISIASEKVTRIKKDQRITDDVINYVFNDSRFSVDEIDCIVVSNYLSKISFSNFKIYKNFIEIKDIDTIFTNTVLKFDGVFFNKNVEVFAIPHHIGHAASSYYLSNFNNAICLTIDSSSSSNKEANSLISIGNGNKLEYIGTSENMVSQIYTSFTAQLGLGVPTLKAGSMMGLSSYGTIDQNVVDNIDTYIESSNNDGDMFNFYTELFKKISGIQDTISSENINNFDLYKNKTKIYNEKKGMNIAATGQYIFEKSILDTINKKIKPYNIKNLCLAGGSFLNCNVNSLIKEDGWFDNIFHCPAAGDDGIALGSALYVAHHIFDEPRQNYSNKQIAYLGQRYAKSKQLDHKSIALDIANGKIVAWFMGASEFGPRALGNRSLLADPRNFHNREIINFAIKNREWFRPFAPSVLEEEAKQWFSPGSPSPFMLYTQKVLMPEKIPAVTHIDGSARIQTVNFEMNEDYYLLIKEFYKITNVPMILNTSLNGGGEPLVETEEDAMNLFLQNDHINILVINGNIYKKN
jgi:carbamoyltransferase